MGKQRFKKFQKSLAKTHLFFIFYLYLKYKILIIFDMYRLYDRDGILRFINSDRGACLDYAELFELSSEHFCLMNLREEIANESTFNPDLNQVKSNN